MIEIAKEKVIEAGVENISFQQGTLDSLNVQNESFDAVLGLNVLHLLKDVDGAISRAHQLLRSGGVFVSSTSLIGDVNLAFRCLISVMQWVRLAPHVSRFTEEQLIDKFVKQGFRIERKLQTSRESVFIVAKKIV